MRLPRLTWKVGRWPLNNPLLCADRCEWLVQDRKHSPGTYQLVVWHAQTGPGVTKIVTSPVRRQAGRTSLLLAPTGNRSVFKVSGIIPRFGPDSLGYPVDIQPLVEHQALEHPWFIPLGKKARRWGLCLGLVLWVGQEEMPCSAASDDGGIPLDRVLRFAGLRPSRAAIPCAGVCEGGSFAAGVQACHFEPSVGMRQSKSSGWINPRPEYLLAQQKELLVTGLDPDDLLPIHPHYRVSGPNPWLATRRRLVVQPNSSSSDSNHHGRVEAVLRMGGSGYRSGVEACQPGSGVVV